MEKYQSPVIPLPDEHMRLVGIIAAHWEWVDLMMQRAVAEVMSHEFSRVHLLTMTVGFRSKCDLMMAHARPLETLDPAMWKQFTAMLELVKKANTARNTYVHAQWNIDDETGQLQRTSVRVSGGSLKAIREKTTTDELAAAAQQIVDAGEAFVRFHQQFDMLLPPSRAKSDEPPPEDHPTPQSS